MLALIARALSANAVPFARLHGLATFESTLDTWRRDPVVRALLLPTRTGSNGLNLTEAQHVILVEPLINPAVEAQASQHGPCHHRGHARAPLLGAAHGMLCSFAN